MASITVRNLDDGLTRQLRVRAARRGRSMEDEAREILRTALATAGEASPNLATAIRRRFATLGGVELDIPPRELLRDPPEMGRCSSSIRTSSLS
jgi:plasmid stability protein